MKQLTDFLHVFVTFSVHAFWTFNIRSKAPPKCVPASGADGRTPPFMNGPFQTLMVVTYSALPFVIILTLNISIVARLRCTPVALKSATAKPSTRHSADMAGERCSMMASGLTIGGVPYCAGTSSVGRTQSSSSTRSVQQVG